jgi:hypothetical protein
MAAQGNTLHEEYRELSSFAGYGVRQAGITGALTTAQVTAATGADDLVADLDSVPQTVHSEYEVVALNAQRALQAGKAIADFTDTRVQAATTVESLVQDTELSNESDAGHLGPQLF